MRRAGAWTIKKTTAIEGNDAVFRVNSPNLKGYETDVGARVTHRIINTADTHQFAWADPRFGDAFTISVLASAVSHESTFLVKARLVPGVERVWLATQAETSGFFALALAASTCKVINMFGFSGPEAQKVLYHYWDVEEIEADRANATQGYHDLGSSAGFATSCHRRHTSRGSTSASRQKGQSLQRSRG
ncbi:hypothetical protein T492DRAFT_1123901 [Pavlovales sp. CCMP2436]|nr:hypothetical protein T492DRAFT_1123901 [Pavlovales sp. CCMP2436]